MRLLAGLLLTLATAHAGDAEIFSASALAARLARLRPVTEEVLGRPIPGEIRVVVVSGDRWAEVVTAEAIRQRGAIEGGKRGKELEEECRERAEVQSFGVLASVEGDVYVVAENFDQFTSTEVRDVLDVVLVHEMAHVFQQRVLGSKAPLRREEAITARAALREGHAEYIERTVAARLGLDAAFDRLERSHAVERPKLEKPSDLAARVWHIFRYGDGERFFAALADRLGYAEAERRTFASPPRTIGQITHPRDYLSGARSDGLRRLADAVLAVLGAADEEMFPIPPAVTRRRLAPVGPVAVAQAMRGVRTTLASTLEIRYGALAGRVARLDLTDTASPAAAKGLFATLRQAARAEGEELIVPGAMWQVFWAAHEDIDIDGAPAFRASRVVRPSDAVSHHNVESIVLLHDHRVVRLLVEAPREEYEHLWRLARRVLSLMRGDPQDGALDGVPEQRFLALAALESPAPTCLSKLLRDPDLEVRATALARATHLALVRQALEDASLRAHAARAAGRYAEAGPLLVALLDDADPRVRENALIALEEFGWAERAERAELLARLEDPEPDVRRAALALVSRVKSFADEERRAALLAYTEDALASVRLAAWTQLLAMKKHEDIPADAWRRGLDDRNGAVRWCVFSALGSRSYRDEGPLPKPEEVRRMASAMRDDHPLIPMFASWRMSRLAPHAKPHLPDLVAALGREDTRSGAVNALGVMRAQAKTALPALLALADVRDVRREVIEALGRISHRHDGVEAVLHAALDDHDAGTRLAAARALSDVGARAPELLPILLSTLEHGDRSSRGHAVDMLKTQKAGAKPALLKALEDPDGWIRSAAVEALIAVDRTPETIVTVSRMLLDSDSWVRQKTAWALEHLDEEAAPAVPMVIRAIEKAESDVLDDYCDILESIGPAAREALPALRKLLQHKDENVREEAQEAIESIEAK